jgi:uncharacterized repeat protein (TIGR03806 family)
MQVVPAFGDQNLTRPIWMGHAGDGSTRLYVIQQGGTVTMFEPDNPQAQSTFLSLSVSRAGNEEGLLGLAFHPDYANNGYVYAYYSAGNPRRSVISRFTRRNNGTADPGSEAVLLEIPQPFGNHNGGDLRFGPDGYLYIAVGDGGSAGDPRNHAQRPETLLGTVLRIDVDTSDPVCGTPYGIPASNPFAADRCQGDMNAGRAEVYAWGLRNIWRMAFDSATGELWAADVGQDAWEEVNIIERGANYGWRPVEGDRCFEPGCDLDAYAAPVHVYGHDEGESITGGFVYRGQTFPELWGAYLFADYISGRIWAYDREADAATLLADTEHRVASFGEDATGELYVLTFSGGARGILRLERRDADVAFDPVPELLSETGCFSDLATMTPAAGVVPYAPIAPFWSDLAEKGRYIALPNGTRMTWRDEDAFDFPDGTVLIKTFELEDEAGTRNRLEVRFLHKDGERWNGYTYKWLPDGSDARLTQGRITEEVAGPRGAQQWFFLDRGQCGKCHTPEANFALGATGRQLNWAWDYGNGQRYNQLQALSEIGLIELPAPTDELPSFVMPGDPSADLDARARAWLDTNCASCHIEGGRADAEIDLRGTIDFAAMRICNAEPRHPGDDPTARILVPGDPQRSTLFTRMTARRTDEQMPPLGSDIIDAQGRDLIRAWISNMDGCP